MAISRASIASLQKLLGDLAGKIDQTPEEDGWNATGLIPIVGSCATHWGKLELEPGIWVQDHDLRSFQAYELTVPDWVKMLHARAPEERCIQSIMLRATGNGVYYHALKSEIDFVLPVLRDWIGYLHCYGRKDWQDLRRSYELWQAGKRWPDIAKEIGRKNGKYWKVRVAEYARDAGLPLRKGTPGRPKGKKTEK